MPTPLYDLLFALANVLHWLGKYDESRAVSWLAKECRDAEVETVAQLEDRITLPSAKSAIRLAESDTLEDKEPTT